MGILKYKIRKFSIQFSKAEAKLLRHNRVQKDRKLENIGTSLDDNINSQAEYNNYKSRR